MPVRNTLGQMGNKLDKVETILLFITILFLLLGINHNLWVVSGTLIFGILFYFYETHRKLPLVDFNLFQNKRYV